MPHNIITADSLFIRELQPSHSPKGAFLLLHGMESHSEWFVDFATRLVDKDYAVIAYDRPGWGKSPGTRGHLANYRDFVETTTRIASQTRTKYGHTHLAGMSWGGMATLYLGLRRGWMFDSLTLLAPGLATRHDLAFKDKCRIAADFLTDTPLNLVTPAFNPEHFTNNPQARQFIQEDQNRIRQVTSSFCHETLKMRRFIKEQAGRRLLPPTLCLLAGKDAIVDNNAAATLCRKAGATVEIIPDAAHTLIFEHPEQVASIIARHADAAHERLKQPTGKVWVVGAGAVGGTVASLLSFGNVETGVAAKPAYLDALTRQGITLQSGLARRNTAGKIAFAADVTKLPGPPDLVVTAVKSFDTDSALKNLIGHIPPSTIVASLQNGVGNEERLANLFPNNTIVAASICASLELANPGHAVWADDRGGLAAALHKGNVESARSVWQNLMTRTGMECRWVDGINAGDRLKWSKLMLNIAFNALNSVTGLTSAAILADPKYGELALRALAEGFAAMERLELDPVDLPGFPVSKMRYLLRMPAAISRKVLAWQAARSPEASFSMRQDILKNRQHTEISELNGKIVEVCLRYGLPVSANEKLTKMVENIDKVYGVS